jgi:tyrosyl-tRNA synthetase
MTLYEEPWRRGPDCQTTHPEEIEKAMNAGPVVFYIGFDATADSLHVGHFCSSPSSGVCRRGAITILLLGNRHHHGGRPHRALRHAPDADRG